MIFNEGETRAILQDEAEMHKRPLSPDVDHPLHFISDNGDGTWSLRDEAERVDVVIGTIEDDRIRIERGYGKSGSGLEDRVIFERMFAETGGETGELLAIRVHVYEPSLDGAGVVEEVSATFVPDEKGELVPWTPVEELATPAE